MAEPRLARTHIRKSYTRTLVLTLLLNIHGLGFVCDKYFDLSPRFDIKVCEASGTGSGSVTHHTINHVATQCRRKLSL